tara:strand:+ start:174 stop:398 length:225 start_codon:yes stop_codon:yes gene_type:complete
MAKAKTATQMAVEALEQISRHEAECGKRWAECTQEIKALAKLTEAHSQRWERVAFLIVGTVLASGLALLTKFLL